MPDPLSPSPSGLVLPLSVKMAGGRKASLVDSAAFPLWLLTAGAADTSGGVCQGEDIANYK